MHQPIPFQWTPLCTHTKIVRAPTRDLSLTNDRYFENLFCKTLLYIEFLTRCFLALKCAEKCPIGSHGDCCQVWSTQGRSASKMSSRKKSTTAARMIEVTLRESASKIAGQVHVVSPDVAQKRIVCPKYSDQLAEQSHVPS